MYLLYTFFGPNVLDTKLNVHTTRPSYSLAENSIGLTVCVCIEIQKITQLRLELTVLLLIPIYKQEHQRRLGAAWPRTVIKINVSNTEK